MCLFNDGDELFYPPSNHDCARRRQCERLSGRRNARVDLGLALLSVLRRPGERLTLDDVAAWCECEPSTIHRIEKEALRKIRSALCEYRRDEKFSEGLSGAASGDAGRG